jgi:hypothetical protein
MKSALTFLVLAVCAAASTIDTCMYRVGTYTYNLTSIRK